MKKKGKILSIVLSVMMLTQLITSVAFAQIELNTSVNAPTNLYWEDNEELAVLANFEHVSQDVEVYLMEFYKDGVLVDCNSWEEDPSYGTEVGEIFGISIILDTNTGENVFAKHGAGDYTFRVGICTDKYDSEHIYHGEYDKLTVAKWSGFSPIYTYNGLGSCGCSSAENSDKH